MPLATHGPAEAAVESVGRVYPSSVSGFNAGMLPWTALLPVTRQTDSPPCPC